MLSFLARSTLMMSPLGGIVKALGTWLSHRSFYQLLCMGLAAFALVQHLEIRSARSSAAKWHTQFTHEHEGREADRKAYIQAQADAAAKNHAQVKAVEQQQQRITTDAETRYQSDLARLRAELAKRLHGGNSAPQGAPVSPGASPVPDATGNPDGSPGVRVSSNDYVRAAETENQLEHLIQWVEQQMKVDPNK